MNLPAVFVFVGGHVLFHTRNVSYIFVWKARFKNSIQNVDFFILYGTVLRSAGKNSIHISVLADLYGSEALQDPLVTFIQIRVIERQDWRRHRKRLNVLMP